MQKTKVSIVEDNHIYRDALLDYLSEYFICDIAVESVEDFLEQTATAGTPNVTLMDIELPGMSGIEGIELIRDRFPSVEIIMLTVFQDHDKIFRSLCAGASGYLLKNTPLEEIKGAIESLMERGAPMTPQIARKVLEHFFPGGRIKPKSTLTGREHEVVNALVDGLTYKQIAERLFVSLDTIRDHIRKIYRKLHVNSKAEVISKSLRGEI